MPPRTTVRGWRCWSGTGRRGSATMSARSRGTRPSGSATNGVTVAALTLIAIQLVWMAVLLAHSYFRQDDFRLPGPGSRQRVQLVVPDVGGRRPPAAARLRDRLGDGRILPVQLAADVPVHPGAAGSRLPGAAAHAADTVRQPASHPDPARLLYVFSPLSLAAITWWAVGPGDPARWNWRYSWRWTPTCATCAAGGSALLSPRQGGCCSAWPRWTRGRWSPCCYSP